MVEQEEVLKKKRTGPGKDRNEGPGEHWGRGEIGWDSQECQKNLQRKGHDRSGESKQEENTLPPRQKLTGAVLAGGQNRRMGGRMKALLPMGGQLFIERQLEALGQVCGDIVIVTNEPELFGPVLEAWERKQRLLEGDPAQQARVRVIPDLHPGLGPLAGMQAAMAASHCEALWVVACDMPFASAAAASTMAERLRSDARCDAVVPRVGQRLHPLHAVYRKRCLHAVSELLDAGNYRVMELLQRLEVAEADDRFFMERGISTEFCSNVNAPEDWSRLQS